MHKCDIGIQKFIAARKFSKLLYNKLYFSNKKMYVFNKQIYLDANEKMESNVAPFVGCPFGKNRDQHQLYFERGCDGDGRSNNIYKWVNPEYNANRQKINRPKMNKEKPYNRKHGDPDNKRLGSLLVYVNILQNKVSERKQTLNFYILNVNFLSVTFLNFRRHLKCEKYKISIRTAGDCYKCCSVMRTNNIVRIRHKIIQFKCT